MSQGEAAISSLESHRKGGPGDRFRELNQDELLLTIAPLVESPVGILGVQEMHAHRGKKRVKGKAWVCSWEGKCALGP